MPVTARPPRAVSPVMRRAFSAAPLALLLSGMLLGAGGCASSPEPDPAPKSAPTRPSPAAEPAVEEPAEEPEGFDRSAYSIDDPDSLWVVTNKLRPLSPLDYWPDDLVVPDVESTNGQPLRLPAAQAVEAMVAAAADEGIRLRIISAFRDYDTQVSVYGSFVANQGQAFADTTSARPGHSEHQTGLTVDFDSAAECTLDECFAFTPAGEWLHAHGPEFGFIERYPAGLESVTGYMPEPWHYRFVGTELALEMRTQGILTLEEFFGLPAAPDYAG